MRFKTGDKVRVSWKPRFGLPVSTFSALRPMDGVVVAQRSSGLSNSKIVVKLANGDYIIQDPNDDDHQWTAIEVKKTIGSRMRTLGKRLFV